MGNFADTLFGVLLGWAKSAVSWLWGVISDDGNGGMLGWILDHWLLLLVLLCLSGVLIDLVVYLLRWQPYRVWRSRRESREEVDALEQETKKADKELKKENREYEKLLSELLAEQRNFLENYMDIVDHAHFQEQQRAYYQGIVDAVQILAGLGIVKESVKVKELLNTIMK